MHKLLWFCLLWLPFSLYSQHNLSGMIYNDEGTPLNSVHLDINTLCTKTLADGSFKFQNLAPGDYTIRIHQRGFLPFEKKISLTKDAYVEIFLDQDFGELMEELVIHSDHGTTYHSDKATSQDIKQNYSGSLAASLTQIPGVQASDIGSGNSKPIIRGLGLNRIVVAENNIKQEGQQWGADHGLEIDALSTEEVEVIKGAGAIAFGSDAIGGVIKINNEKIPSEGISGNFILHGKTVNNALGSTLVFRKRQNNYFYKIKFSGVDYADYKVPTNEINYLSTRIPIYNSRMKNTAGNEYSGYLQGGFVSDSFFNIFTLSHVYSKIGFFPGAHGIPSIAAVSDDGNSRNVGYPYQSVHHFKLINHSQWKNDHAKWDLTFGFQNNRRREYSKFHTHYSNQIPPVLNPDLELDFSLNTLESQLSYEFENNKNQVFTFGVQNTYQENQVQGYSYLLPEYQQHNMGLYAKYHWDVSEKWQLDFGVRADHYNIKINGFFDNILYQYLIHRGYDEQTSTAYAQRSKYLEKNYPQINGILGVRYQTNKDWTFLYTIGSNFRIPTAMELSSNGIHHGAFRHEQGNPNLNPERGFSTEWIARYQTDNSKVSFSPFLYYFDNYIFLKPTGRFSILPHGGQVYEYSQSKALITGFELAASKRIKQWEGSIVWEYLYNQQISSTKLNYPLPFTPPINVYGELSYHLKNNSPFEQMVFAINGKWANAQNRIAQNENATPAYAILGMRFSTEWNIGKFKSQIQIQGNNLLNSKYYNHASFYRAIEIPELARNIQIVLSIPFN